LADSQKGNPEVFEEMLALVLHISERLAAPLPSRDPTTYLYLHVVQ
jgi:hypothetical protein